MKKEKILLQQGDVLIEMVDSLPENAEKMKEDKRGIVFAEGEATGHYHAVQEKEKSRMFNCNGVLYFENECPVDIEHQEHDTITIPAGIWKIGKVMEYDHFSEEAREVID